MMSQTHPMMSQQQQVVETTPGHSHKLFADSDTANLTEKIESSHQGHNRQHNDGNFTFLGSLLDVPVKHLNGIAEQKQQSNLHTQGDL